MRNAIKWKNPAMDAQTCIHSHRHTPHVCLQSQTCTSQTHGPTSQTQALSQTYLPIIPIPYACTHTHLQTCPEIHINTLTITTDTHAVCIFLHHMNTESYHRHIHSTDTQPQAYYHKFTQTSDIGTHMFTHIH